MQLGRLAGLGEILLAVGQGSSCWQLVGAFEEGLQPLPPFSSFQMEEGVLWKAVMYLSLLSWVSSVCLHPL